MLPNAFSEPFREEGWDPRVPSVADAPFSGDFEEVTLTRHIDIEEIEKIASEKV